MDPIRPIGPPERDVEPVVRVTRSSPDARRERPDPREQEQQRRERPEPPAPDDESGTSLIDVRV
ncbi:MAG: hypothetical protein QOF55_1645 [Thermoleophilaceae bacterium]|jgi:hypothetical protein|nr:hypothetical protein [Thermoleophilaceae bacterium]